MGIGEASIVEYQFGLDVIVRVEEHITRSAARNDPLHTKKQSVRTQKRPDIAAGPRFGRDAVDAFRFA